MIEEGQKAPAIALTTTRGETIDLSAPGGRLVLYFYPKDDTSGCTKEAQAFSDLADEFAAAGVAVVGVSRDDLRSHEKFIAKYGLRVPLAVDEGPLSEAFGTWIQKSMYGRNYMGMERATFLIDSDGTVLRAWRKVKVPGHAEEVLKAAQA